MAAQLRLSQTQAAGAGHKVVRSLSIRSTDTGAAQTEKEQRHTNYSGHRDTGRCKAYRQHGGSRTPCCRSASPASAGRHSHQTALQWWCHQTSLRSIGFFGIVNALVRRSYAGWRQQASRGLPRQRCKPAAAKFVGPPSRNNSLLF